MFTNEILDKLSNEFVIEDHSEETFMKDYLIFLFEKGTLRLTRGSAEVLLNSEKSLDLLYKVSNIQSIFEENFSQNDKIEKQICYNIRRGLKDLQ